MAAKGEATYARRAVQDASREKVRVLFIVSPLTIGADTWVHLLLLRKLPQTQFELHAAGQSVDAQDAPSAVDHALREMSGIALRPTNFGPSIFGQSSQEKLRSTTKYIPAVVSLLGLAHYIREHRIQIIHATDRPRDAIACMALAVLTGAKAVIHVHVKCDRWMTWGVKAALARADTIIGVSRFVADSLVAGGHRPERVHAVLNAVDVACWDPSLSPAPGRESLGVSMTTPLILSVARLFHWKGHAELIRALAIVKQQVNDVQLAIVGADYPVGSGRTQELQALAEELGVSQNVVFTGHRHDVGDLLAACDVFALPSFEEPFGLVYAEAMAMERPVVALSNGGTPEVIEHGKSGLLSAPADIEALAAHLLQLIRDPALRRRMGKYARKQVERLLAPERLVNEVGALYSQLLE